MAEMKIPIKIDGFKCVEDMAQAVLNYTYKGKTLKEWTDSISEPKTNADRIRSMSDEELARLFADGNCGYCRIHDFCFAKGCQIDCEDVWLDWLKQEVSTDG